MQPSLWLVLAISLAGDVVVFLTSIVLLAHKKTIAFLTKYATPFAAGALLAAAFLDFLHDGVENYNPLTVLLAALVGVLFFFVLEGWLHWFHHHSKEPFEPKSGQDAHHHETDPIVALAAGGNWLHNFIDGGAIAAAFLVSVSAGIITTIAVAMHEIPREMADSGYLLKRGLGRRGVLMVHGVAIGVTALGTVLFYTLGRHSQTLLAILIGSTAGFFIYIAASDIIPSINQSRNEKKLIDWQVVLVILGAVIVGAAVLIAHHFIPA
jgi:zinc and cadmium transporter